MRSFNLADVRAFGRALVDIANGRPRFRCEAIPICDAVRSIAPDQYRHSPAGTQANPPRSAGGNIHGLSNCDTSLYHIDCVRTF